jgi:hypothetical protein
MRMSSAYLLPLLFAGGDGGGEGIVEPAGIEAECSAGELWADYLRLRRSRLEWRDEKSDSQHCSPLLRHADGDCRLWDCVQVLPPGRGVARVRAGTGGNRRP